MKRLIAVTIVAASLVFMAGCVSKLLYNKTLPEIKAPADKALCVIIRPTAFMGSDFVPIYCDQKYVGATEGNTMLTFDVEPGEHYIIGNATNKSKAKFNFVAGKIYFIFHTVVTVRQSIGPATVTIVTSTFASSDGESAMKKIESEKGKITWVQKNPEDKDSKDLDAKDFEDVKKDYATWAGEAKNAEEAKKEAEYPGY